MTCNNGKCAPRMLSTKVSLAADKCATKYNVVTSVSFTATTAGAVTEGA